MNAEDEIARSLHEVPELVAHAIAPVPPSRAENASHAKELLKHRATIHAQERLVFSLRADLAARSQATARSEDQRRALAGELADLRARLDEVEKEAARAEQRATRARVMSPRARTPTRTSPSAAARMPCAASNSVTRASSKG